MSKESRAEYYEKAFQRLEETGEHTWNWAAFWGSFGWMTYRKMFSYLKVGSIVGMIFWGVIGIIFGGAWYGIFGEINKSSWEAAFSSKPGVAAAFVCVFLIVAVLAPMIFFGRFGNALYYRSVKGKILRGYHLQEKHRPTSFWAIFFPWLFWAVDEISYDLQQNEQPGCEVNAETIHAYLNPNKEKHWAVRVANGLSAIWIVIMFCYNIAQSIYKEKAADDVLSNINKIADDVSKTE